MNLAKDWLSIAIALISLFGFVTSGALYWQSRVIKNYAAERDFAHIKGNLQQFSEALGHFDDRHDEMRMELREIKAGVQTFSQRLDAILTRFELNSGIFGHRRNDET